MKIFTSFFTRADDEAIATMFLKRRKCELALLGIPDGKASLDGPLAYWGVPDAAAELNRLEQLGAKIIDPAHEVGDGIHVASVADPFGNSLGIIQNPHFLPRESAIRHLSRVATMERPKRL